MARPGVIYGGNRAREGVRGFRRRSRAPLRRGGRYLRAGRGFRSAAVPCFFLPPRIRLRESLRKNRGRSAEKQTPKTGAFGSNPGRGKEKRRKWKREIDAHLVLADGKADWVAERFSFLPLF